MKYKLLFLLILVFVFLFTQKNVKAESEIIDKIKLKIAILEVDVSVDIDRLEYCPPEVVNITNTIENTGSLNTTGNLTVRIIFTDTGQVVYTETTNDIEVLVGETVYVNTYYTVSEINNPGMYTVESNFTYNGKSSFDSNQFRIKIGVGTPRVYPRTIEDTIPPGRSRDWTIMIGLEYACRNSTAFLNTSIGDAGDWVTFFEDEVFLSTTETNTTVATITVNQTPVGTYYGTIYVNIEEYQIPIDLIINVTGIDFEINVTVPPERKEVCPGEGVYAELNITKYLPNETVNVSVTYQIIDYDNNVLDQDNETIEINETPIIKDSPILIVPNSANPAIYMFLVTLEFNSSIIQQYDVFEVISCIITTTQPPGPGPGAPVRPPPIVQPVYAIELNLSTDILSVFTGNRTSFLAYVTNIGTAEVKSIRISIDGIPDDWISVIPDYSNLKPGETKEYLIIIDVPEGAEVGTYELRIKAVNTVESETRTVVLIIGRNLKEIADLLLQELDKSRAAANRSLIVEDCIDVTIVKTFYYDAHLALEKGLEEYKKGDYGRAINWFEYAIPVNKKVVYSVDISIEMEIEASNNSKSIIPPIFDPEEQFLLAENYLDEKVYEKLCDPIEEIRKYILIGLIFWPALIILFIILIILIVIFYRRKRRRERSKILERVKERLAKFSEKKTEKDEKT